MPVHVIDFPITITKFSITLPITSYVAILNYHYHYHYHYFSKVIICNPLQLQITITISLVCIVFFLLMKLCAFEISAQHSKLTFSAIIHK